MKIEIEIPEEVVKSGKDYKTLLNIAANNIFKSLLSDIRYHIVITSNSYKGSGRCWIANIDDNKKIQSFVKEDSNIKDGYRNEKSYDLPSGKYLINQEGSKSHDDREYIVINDNGDKTKF